MKIIFLKCWWGEFESFVDEKMGKFEKYISLKTSLCLKSLCLEQAYVLKQAYVLEQALTLKLIKNRGKCSNFSLLNFSIHFNESSIKNQLSCHLPHSRTAPIYAFSLHAGGTGSGQSEEKPEKNSIASKEFLLFVSSLACSSIE